MHGMNPEWCSQCNGTDQPVPGSGASDGYYGGETKQDLLNALCDLLSLPSEPIGEGSSLPSHVFLAAAERIGVPLGSMPEIGEAIAQEAGLAWGADCDSRGSISGGGSTVTAEGLRVMLKSLEAILA